MVTLGHEIIALTAQTNYKLTAALQLLILVSVCNTLASSQIPILTFLLTFVIACLCSSFFENFYHLLSILLYLVTDSLDGLTRLGS